jgi:uncharacterized oligopeptide transporter (OPT) family protein
MNAENKTDSAGIASFVIAIVSCFLFPLILGIVAILLGVSSEQKSGLATAGIVIAIVSMCYTSYIYFTMF